MHIFDDVLDGYSESFRRYRKDARAMLSSQPDVALRGILDEQSAVAHLVASVNTNDLIGEPFGRSGGILCRPLDKKFVPI
jgi:hypothetical protein